MAGIADVLDREVDWLTAVLPGLPSLAEHFDVIAAHVRRLAQHPRQLYVGLLATRDTSPTKNGDRRLEHDVVALTLYPALGAGARAHADRDRAEVAVAAVVDRIAVDRTHGGRWWSISDATVAPPDPITMLAFADVLAVAGSSYAYSITWTATEHVDRPTLSG